MQTRHISKSLIVVLCLFFSATALPPHTAGAVEGLVGHWSFDDRTGKDLSGNGNDAVLKGATVYTIGKGRACIRLLEDAEPMHIPASEDSPLAISRGTICFWLNAGWGRTTILQYDNDAVQLNEYRGDFQVRFQGEQDFMYWTGILDYDWPKYDMREWAFYGHPKAAIGDSQWHFFAVAYDDREKQIVGWRDAELISVVDLSAVETEPLRRKGLTKITTGEGFRGFIDDLRIYNTPLKYADIRRIYDSTKFVYARRSDTIPHDREVQTYKYRPEDRTLYRAWLQNNPAKLEDDNLLKRIVAEGRNSTVRTAASELKQAAKEMLDFEASIERKHVAGPKLIIGTPQTSPWIRSRTKALGLNRVKQDGFVIKAITEDDDTILVIAADIPAGVVFGAFDLIRRIQLGQNLSKLDVLENPRIPIRMVDHWAYFRGFPHDGWRGGGRDDSIYSWEELRAGDTKLIRDWVRMMASAGWNAICPSEVNWHYRDNFLDHLDEVEKLAGILRDYGMKLYWTPSYLLALDRKTADKIYARVPDFGGYMMKLGSEKQNGDPRPPMVNRIADTVLPYGGHVLVRGFCYGNLRYTPEPYRDLIPHDIFAREDGKFRKNVVLVPKGSAGDWDFSAPIPAIDGAMKKTLSGSELVIDKSFPSSWVEKWEWWLEQDTYRSGPGSFNKSIAHCIMGVAMISPSPAWTSSPLNMVNYYGLGRLAWNPDRSLDEIYNEWIIQTFGSDPVVIDKINRILLMSDDVARKLYMYRGYRGIWIDKGDENMVENKTPYAINNDRIGPASQKLAKRLLAQYAPGLQEIYGDPLRGEEFLSSFHIKPHDYRLSIGRTLIEDVYGGMEEAVQIAAQMVELWKTLQGKIDHRRFEYTLEKLLDFVESAKRNRDEMAQAFEQHTDTKRKDALSRLTAPALAAVGTYNVRHFGAVGDGTANDAPAINKAIDACNKAGGGTVFVPSGYYTITSIHLKSNITLALDKGAVLKAMPGTTDTREASLIRGKNLDNVKIYGPGIIDAAFVRSSQVKQETCGNGIALNFCEDVEIRNLNINKSGQNAILAINCAGLLIDNVTIKTDKDGLNLSQCEDVLIANCHVNALEYEDGYPTGGGSAVKFGDALSLRQHPTCKNVTVRNSFLASGPNSPAFSEKLMKSPGSIRFDNTKILHAGKATNNLLKKPE